MPIMPLEFQKKKNIFHVTVQIVMGKSTAD